MLQSWGDNGAILGIGNSINGQAFMEIAHKINHKNYDGISLQFRVNDLSPFVHKFRGRLDFRGPTPRPWGSTYLYVEDPNGILVILYEGTL